MGRSGRLEDDRNGERAVAVASTAPVPSAGTFVAADGAAELDAFAELDEPVRGAPDATATPAARAAP